jgi:maltose/maltodextrin transport system substrate-binding protein
VGVLACYINRASPNQDIAKEFIENFLLSEEGLKAMDEAKPIGIPSLVTLANEMERTNPLLQQLQLCAEQGEIMPNIPEMGRFWSAVGSALQTATNKQTPIPQALQEAADSMRKQ